MAGSSMAFTYHPVGGFLRIDCAWTSDDADGSASGTTANIAGYLIKAVTDPGATAPDANYDVTLKDEETVDLLGLSHDDLVDRHTSNTEQVYFNLKPDAAQVVGAYPVVAGPITVAVANAGNSKVGQIKIYVEGVKL